MAFCHTACTVGSISVQTMHTSLDIWMSPPRYGDMSTPLDDTAPAEIHVCVPGAPVGKQRPRMTRRGAVYTPQRTVDYERAVRDACRQMLPAGWDPTAQYALVMRVYYGDRRRRDLDNVIKSISDGLNGVAWRDDSQVCLVAAGRDYDAADPRVEVTIHRRSGWSAVPIMQSLVGWLRAGMEWLRG